MADEIELPVSGILGMGAEIVGSAASARMGDGAVVAGEFEAAADTPPASTSANWSSRSDSSRPFEVSSR
jgi:hypothetical protein